ncbi:uncharacterized protein BYT42DRAFT_611531 [Radiomyces spectabilis]|uniref:uncharacterized protein n=1 Tax=Radiomyces spectabilis TaxID=64574 RepID=UPI00221F7A7F|nr:uncharacterized protein BYT42DRAFT_611531 [Radiomyces spectabilis]KAI8388495.1 hypothetical protein BYT42DRAFT_611531 [Radiomyces spectabilis]
MVRQLRILNRESSHRWRRASSNNKNHRRQSLQVTISKEPPTIQYFERDNLEDSFECIFDPMVCHDDEKDHPDLFVPSRKQLKPWQKPPYTDCYIDNQIQTSFLKRLVHCMVFQNNSQGNF